MSDQPGKPAREWKINTISAEGEITSLNNFGNNIGEFRVIEYSAYQKVVAECEWLREEAVRMAGTWEEVKRSEWLIRQHLYDMQDANKVLVEALKDISAYFGTDYADGHAVTAHDALERHAKIMEGVWK